MMLNSDRKMFSTMNAHKVIAGRLNEQIQPMPKLPAFPLPSFRAFIEFMLSKPARLGGKVKATLGLSFCTLSLSRSGREIVWSGPPASHHGAMLKTEVGSDQCN